MRIFLRVRRKAKTRKQVLSFALYNLGLLPPFWRVKMVHYAFYPLIIFAAVAIKICVVGAWVDLEEQRRARVPATPQRRFAYTSVINGVREAAE